MHATIGATSAPVNQRLKLTTAIYFFTDQLTLWTFRPIKGYPSQFNRDFAVKGRRWLTIVSCPSLETAQYLDRYQPIITRIEGAANLIAANQHDNDANKDFVVTHIVIKFRRGTHEIIQHENTVYFMQREDINGRRRRGKVVGIYNDRPCKKTKRRFCTKIDLRMQGSAIIAADGIHCCVDAVRFNWREYFSDRIRFCRVDFDRFGTLERKRAQRHGYRRVVDAQSTFARLAKVTLNGEIRYCVQEFVKAMGGGHYSCLVDIPVWSIGQKQPSTAEQANFDPPLQRRQWVTRDFLNNRPLTRDNDKVSST
jgi:hypothetical protein